MTSPRFDDSLPVLAELIINQLGQEALSAGTVLRDANGRLTFFSATPLTQEVSAKLAKELSETLGPYARADRPLADTETFGAERVLNDPLALLVTFNGYPIRLVDRRMVGADWLRSPNASQPNPPRFVFASLKGGVGRSTALAVTAADLASRGLRVLVIDLDLEAPGLGAILLDDATLPEFGVLDALVENGLGGLDEAFLRDLIGPSALAGGRGRIDVMPVLGKRSLRNPGEIMAKIARAYLEDVDSSGKVASILDQVSALVGDFSDPERYDAILVDARAGLHETTAAALLGLGAEVFLFGLDERQTLQGFEALFAHLARLPRTHAGNPEWLNHFTLVQGKAPIAPELRQEFAQQCRTLFLKTLQQPQQPSEVPETPFGDIPWDDELPDSEVLPNDSDLPGDPLAVLDDEKYRNFDPLARRDLLSERVYQATFGELLGAVHAYLPILEGEPL